MKYEVKAKTVYQVWSSDNGLWPGTKVAEFADEGDALASMNALAALAKAREEAKEVAEREVVERLR